MVRPAARRALPRAAVMRFALIPLAALTGAVTLSVPAAWAQVRLEKGMFVEVEGDWKPPRGLVADELDVRAGRRDDDVEIIAPLDSVAADGLSLTVFGVAIPLSPSADVPSPALVAGEWVEIDGTAHVDGLTVRRVRRLAAPASDVEIEGPITEHDPGSRKFRIAGFPVHLSRDTDIRGIARELVPRAIDDDDANDTRWTLAGDRVRIGGRLQWKVEPEENYDLNERRAGDLTEAAWFAEVQADTRLGAGLDAFVKAGLQGTRIVTDEEGDEIGGTDIRLQQAYAIWTPDPNVPVALQVGRQDFDESREWLYDENLDGVRIHALTGPLRTEASVSTRFDTPSARLRDWTNWMLVSELEIRPRWDVGAYVIHRRRADDPGNRPAWLGVRSSGRLASPLRHWAELSLLRGNLDGLSRSAWAVDLGVRARLHRASRLSATVGWAAGSGGDDPSSVYRQTSLQDNNDKFGGVSSFRYYGELLEPELSNLEIRTAGLGFRPLRSTSIDLIAHRYRQRTPADRILSNLDSRPRGLSGDIGSEWNLVVAFEEIHWFEVEYIFARFSPGDAFPSTATPARFHKLQIQLRF